MTELTSFEVGQLWVQVKRIADSLVAERSLSPDQMLANWIGLRGAWQISGSRHQEIPNWLYPDAGMTYVTGPSLTGVGKLESGVPYWQKYAPTRPASTSSIYDITGGSGDATADGWEGLTVGAWVNVSDWGGSIGGVINKYRAAGDEKSFGLYYVESSDEIRFAIWDSDTTTIRPVDIDAPGLDEWFFVVGRYTNETELAVSVNGSWSKVATSVPDVKISTAPLEFFTWEGTDDTEGLLAYPFLYASAISDDEIGAFYDLTYPLIVT